MPYNKELMDKIVKKVKELNKEVSKLDRDIIVRWSHGSSGVKIDNILQVYTLDDELSKSSR